jgi:hypothetical protein
LIHRETKTLVPDPKEEANHEPLQKAGTLLKTTHALTQALKTNRALAHWRTGALGATVLIAALSLQNRIPGFHHNSQWRTFAE